MDLAIAEGIRFFNAQRFFEAHEALEAVWLKAQGDEKSFLHGLIQVAAAFHHYHRGNAKGFRTVLEKAMQKLEKFEGVRAGIDVTALRDQIACWSRLIENSGSIGRTRQPALPIIMTNENR